MWVEFQRADTTFGPVREEIQGGSSLNTGMLVGQGRHVKVIEKCSVVGDAGVGTLSPSRVIESWELLRREFFICVLLTMMLLINFLIANYGNLDCLDL